MENKTLMVSIREASERTGLSSFCLRRLCLTDQIIYIKSGAKYYINYFKLLDFLNRENVCSKS